VDADVRLVCGLVRNPGGIDPSVEVPFLGLTPPCLLAVNPAQTCPKRLPTLKLNGLTVLFRPDWVARIA